MAYKFIFEVQFDSDEKREAYVDFWKQTSDLIQEYPGARGTRLHNVLGRNAVLAIAEWESKADRDAALTDIRANETERAKTINAFGDDEDYGQFVPLVEIEDRIQAFPPPAES